MRWLPAHKVRAIALHALANGGVLRPFLDGTSSRTVYWDVSGRCSRPVAVLLHGRRELKNERFAVITDDPISKPWFVEMDTPCRRCVPCLKARAGRWRFRASAEFASATRTWLATFTLAPAIVNNLTSRCRVYLGRGGQDYDALPLAEQQAMLFDELYSGAIAKSIGLDPLDTVQRWLKRIRKNSGCEFRFLAIGELHKSGVPHWHLLLHEQHANEPLRYDKHLKGSWKLGFSSFKLARDKPGAVYVTKYLSKDLAARVRASKSYGAAEDSTLPPNVKAKL